MLTFEQSTSLKEPSKFNYIKKDYHELKVMRSTFFRRSRQKYILLHAQKNKRPRRLFNVVKVWIWSSEINDTMETVREV